MWPLDLLFRDAYWNDSCSRVLGQPLHHHPTRGGPADQDQFHERYRAMIRSARQPFREPPTEMGLLVEVRFGRHRRRQRGAIRQPSRPWRGWRWSTRSGTLLLGGGLLGCGSAKAAARSGSESSPVNVDVLLLQQALQGLLLNVLTVLVALVCVKVGSVVSAWLLRPLVLRPSGLSTPPQLDNEQLAYLSGGPTRVVELGACCLKAKGPNPPLLIQDGNVVSVICS